MKKFYILFFAAWCSFISFSQREEETENNATEIYEEDDQPEEETYSSDHEVGIDGNFSASNFNGSAGIGLKLGFIKNDKFIFGPSIRYQQSWSNFNGVKTGFSVYGGGAFIHARLVNYFFLGMEFEMLSSPLQYGMISTQRKWVPVALIGGGFSHAFSENFRLNAGIMIDAINHQDSPLRMGYFMKNNNGVLLPVLYRIASFFPI
jgi:hypothetical protein